MSDALRESTTDKAKSSLKPDSQKGVLEKGQEKVQGAADSVGKTLQPEGEKSATQKASDTVTGSSGSSSGAKDAQAQGEGLLNQAGNTLSNAATSAQDALGLGKK